MLGVKDYTSEGHDGLSNKMVKLVAAIKCEPPQFLVHTYEKTMLDQNVL